MRRNFWISISILVVVCAMTWATKRHRSNPQDLRDLSNRLFEKDREVLTNATSDSERVVAALNRLGPTSDPVIKPSVDKWIKSENPKLRAALANALGFAPDAEAIPHLNALLRDQVSAVRAAAINALGTRASVARKEVLLSIWKNRTALSDEESLQLGIRLAQSESDPKNKEPYDAFLANLVKSGKSNTVRLQAAMNLLTTNPANENVKEQLRSFIEHRSQNPELAIQSFRILSSHGDAYVKDLKLLEKLATDTSTSFRSIVAQALTANCVPGSDEIIVKLMSDANPSVRSIAQRSALQAPKDHAIRLLERARTKAPDQAEVDLTIKEVKKLDRPGDACFDKANRN